MEKKYGTFVAKMLYFQNFLDLIWTWTSRFKKNFGLWLDLD